MESDQIDGMTFRARPDRRPRRAPSRQSGIVWAVIAIIAPMLFVLTLRTLLHRTARGCFQASQEVSLSMLVFPTRVGSVVG